ncbi:MAG: PEP-CTERM sorting domain-containing protein [Bythopirellula sp.]|nr:PEP-CTERM sorting domain-containing protein [Bythopirellula sp.]
MAQFYINEIYFDPPGETLDFTDEYIELRGSASFSLADHYLIFLENEISATADPGVVEYIFDLGALSTPTLGSNGFLRLRQAGNVYPAAASGTTDLANTGTSFTWGSGATSTVGFTGEAGKNRIENSGFTAMLIKNNGGAATKPFVATTTPGSPVIDLDADDDNELDAGGFLASWTVLDSVGLNSEASDINGYLYAPVNFSTGTPVGGGNVPAGAEFVDVGYEIEYIGRWGDSTGSTRADWHVSNVTNEGGAGFDGPADYRQSGDPHGIGTPNQFVETSQGVPYGSYILGTPGASNIFIQDGDYDPTYSGEEFVFDGDVDGRDFLAWQRNAGFGLDGMGNPRFATRQHGDGNLDRVVDSLDLAVWQANYGAGGGPLVALSQAVPEPSTLGLLLLGSICCWRRARG